MSWNFVFQHLSSLVILVFYVIVYVNFHLLIILFLREVHSQLPVVTPATKQYLQQFEAQSRKSKDHQSVAG